MTPKSKCRPLNVSRKSVVGPGSEPRDGRGISLVVLPDAKTQS